MTLHAVPVQLPKAKFENSLLELEDKVASVAGKRDYCRSQKRPKANKRI